MGEPQRGTEGAPGAMKEERSQPVRKAEADFQSAQGLKVDGDVELEEVDSGVRLVVEVDDAPAGTKAIHVHEKGDCSNMKQQSMGSHFNPAGQPHGMPASSQHHAGDLGNIVIDASGDGKLEIVARNVNLKPDDPMSILNRAIVIHESEDKGTQPTGGSGAPIACAVIRAD
jgi:Cu-Zn family superoxide dismutase